MNINANSFHPLLREIQQLAAHMDQNVLAGLLLVRSASPGFAPSNLQLRIPNFFDDVFQSDIECGASAPWYMVEGTSPKECRYALIHALQHIPLPRHLLEHLRSSIDSAAIDEIQLGKLVHLLSHLPANPQLLSQVYEANMAAAIPSGGPIPGDFYTPASIVRQIAEMLELKEGSLYDPCCGSGAMLYSTALSLPHGEQLSLFGQASDTNTYQLCQINAILHGLAVDLGGQPADVLNKDLQNGRYFDYILANPPFNLSNWCEGLSPCDERLKYGLPPRSNANYMWLQHIPPSVTKWTQRSDDAQWEPDNAATSREGHPARHTSGRTGRSHYCPAAASLSSHKNSLLHLGAFQGKGARRNNAVG